MQPAEPTIISNSGTAPVEAKEKRTNWPVILLTLTTLLFAGLAVFFGIEYFKAKSSQHIEGEPGISVGDNTPSAPLNGGEITNGAGDVSDTSAARDRVLTFDKTKMQNAVAGVNYAMVTNRCENDVDEHGSALG